MDIGETNKDGWTRVPDHESGIARYVHACQHCGQPDAMTVRITAPGEPGYYAEGSHEDAHKCVQWLRRQVETLLTCKEAKNGE